MRGSESTRKARASAVACAAALAAVAATGAAQPPTVQAGGETGSYVEMEALLEKTIFKVDVLTLTVRVFADRGRIIGELAAQGHTAAAEDSIATLAIHSQDAWAKILFRRDVSLGQFLDGIDDNMSKAANAGIIRREDYDMITAGLPRWFGFLEQEGITKGDRILYRIRGDSLRTQYRTAAGEIRLDQTDVGPERRLAVLGSYFVRGSGFRRKLIESVFRPQ